jgi:hypothetical protein
VCNIGYLAFGNIDFALSWGCYRPTYAPPSSGGPVRIALVGFVRAGAGHPHRVRPAAWYVGPPRVLHGHGPTTRALGTRVPHSAGRDEAAIRDP